MNCKYKYTFPIDEFGRIGGMYSLADVPVSGTKEFTREGILTARDSSRKLYEVKDAENGWTFVIPYNKVMELIDETH